MPPNVLLLVADDLPRNILGSYGASHGLLPELDALSRNGLTFSRAYTVAPLCAPSRYSLLTGTYASRGAREERQHEPSHNTSRGRTPAARITRQVDQVSLSHQARMPPTVTLAKVLRSAGYYTGLLGKYDVGHKLQPSDCGSGARVSAGLAAAGAKLAEAGAKLADPAAHADQSCRTIGNQSCLAASIRQHAGFDHVADVYYDNDALTLYAHQPEWMTHEALRFVRAARHQRRPYFLWMAPSLTNSPSNVVEQLLSEPRAAPAGCGGAAGADLSESAAFISAARRTRSSLLARLSKAGLVCRKDATEWRMCPDEKLPSPSTLMHPEPWLPTEQWFAADGLRAGLATSVAQAAWLDASLAPLFAELTQGKGALEQTLTVFTADHGPSFLGKGHAYEAGVRVPLIVNWFNGPQQAGGRVVDDPVTHIDLMPTLAAIAGGEESMPLVDGREIAAMTKGVTTQKRQPLFIEVGFSRTVIVERLKLILHLLPPAYADDGTCRSIHGVKLPGASAAKSRVKLLYDVADRHPQHHCDRVQLYNLTADPAEQHNLASTDPWHLESLRSLIMAHVAAVEEPPARAEPSSTSGGSTGEFRTVQNALPWVFSSHPGR